MIDPPALRPLSEHVATVLPDDLIINIKSRGQWACFRAAGELANCLLRPGVLEFSGPASAWRDKQPVIGFSGIPTPSLLADCLVPAPIARHGVMFIDYDARQATAIHDAPVPSSFVLVLDGPWSSATPGSREYDWARALFATGRLRCVRVAQSRGRGLEVSEVPLPAFPRSLRANPCGWAVQEAAFALGAQVEDLAVSAFFEAPIQAPGWAFQEAGPATPAAIEILHRLAPSLHDLELLAWKQWAARSGNDGLADTAATLLRARHMDRSLPPPTPVPARQRM